MGILILAFLALLSLGLTLWQWVAARRFPLHQRPPAPAHFPSLTLLKPLKGYDQETEGCLSSWLEQDYPAPVEVLFGVASAEDPVVPLVQRVLAAHPGCHAQLVICNEACGANGKVSTLAQLQRRARHEVLVVSDADVRVPEDLLRSLAACLCEPQVGLVNCLYWLANPATRAMQWEAVATNGDFWSQVLQARAIGSLDFAMGAVMAFRRETLEAIGGWESLADYLADDYELGNRIHQLGEEIVLCPVVAECWESPQGWAAVWDHQVRWARTIRVCRPVAYFFSLLSNATLWPLLWLLASVVVLASGRASGTSADWVLASAWIVAPVCLLVRIGTAGDQQRRLQPSGSSQVSPWWMVVLKDLLQVAIWVAAFAGNHVEWRGDRYRVRHDGRLVLVRVRPRGATPGL
jgi:ceramide glucosyltransferase